MGHFEELTCYARSVAASHKLIPQPSRMADGRNQNALAFRNFYGFDDQTVTSPAGSTIVESPPPTSSDEGPSPYSILNSAIGGPIDQSPLS
jgi:hypothetical protein